MDPYPGDIVTLFDIIGDYVVMEVLPDHEYRLDNGSFVMLSDIRSIIRAS